MTTDETYGKGLHDLNLRCLRAEAALTEREQELKEVAEYLDNCDRYGGFPSTVTLRKMLALTPVPDAESAPSADIPRHRYEPGPDGCQVCRDAEKAAPEEAGCNCEPGLGGHLVGCPVRWQDEARP